MLNRIDLTPTQLQQILNGLKDVRICFIGDVCLDMYWYADMRRSRLSRETPHFPLPIGKEEYLPGGGGNVINNINTLGVKKLVPVSVIGSDWRGYLLNDWFQRRKIDTTYLFQSDRVITPCYCKPLRKGISDVVYEDPRLDFENYEKLKEEDETRVINALEEISGQVDIVTVSDQYSYGVVTPRVREKLTELSAKGVTVIVDSREKVQEYRHVIVKPNEVEAVLAVGGKVMDAGRSNEDYAEVARQLFIRNEKPVVVTLGGRGSIWCDENGPSFAPAVKQEPPIDSVGAGDTFLSAFSCAMAAGADGGHALAFGNLVSCVTVKKIGTTGTATPEEIIDKYREDRNEP